MKILKNNILQTEYKTITQVFQIKIMMYSCQILFWKELIIHIETLVIIKIHSFCLWLPLKMAINKKINYQIKISKNKVRVHYLKLKVLKNTAKILIIKVKLPKWEIFYKQHKKGPIINKSKKKKAFSIVLKISSLHF